MTLKHKNKEFEIFELVEPFTTKKITSDMISVFEIIQNDDDECEYKFIDYICGSLESDKDYTLHLVIELVDNYIETNSI